MLIYRRGVDIDSIPNPSSITLGAELLLTVGLLVSPPASEHRIWPLPGRRGWQFWFVWIALSVTILGLAAFAVLDRSSLFFTDLLRHGVGLPLLVGGLALDFRGRGIHGWRRTSGHEGKLKTDRFYRWSRKPQYLGDIADFLGLVPFSIATSKLVPGLVAAALFAFRPVSDEPRLSERFGEAYERYCQRAPRFV